MTDRYLKLPAAEVRRLATNAIQSVTATRQEKIAHICDTQRQSLYGRWRAARGRPLTDAEALSRAEELADPDVCWATTFGLTVIETAERLLQLAEQADTVEVFGRDLERIAK